MTRRFAPILLLFLLLVSSCFVATGQSTVTEAEARKHHNPSREFKPAVPITPLFPNGPPDLTAGVVLDKRLAAGAAQTVLQRGGGEIRDARIDQFRDVANDVFHRLIAAGFGQQYPWKLTLVNSTELNAFSTPYGHVYVCRGLLDYIGTDPGLWAAVLAHEVAHSGLRHGLKEYLIKRQMRRTLASSTAGLSARGNIGTYWTRRGLSYRPSPSDPVRRLRRALEIEADQAGMLIMARSGYHPDYVFALYHVLAQQHGQQSKFALLTDHPTWEARERENDGAYAAALAEFNRYWPHAARSPGGAPPTVVFFGDADVTENQAGHSTIVSVPVWCRNSARPIRLEATFQPGAPHADNAGANSKMKVTSKAGCSGTGVPAQVRFRIPAEISTGEDSELFGVVMAYTKKGQFLGASNEFEIMTKK